MTRPKVLDRREVVDLVGQLGSFHIVPAAGNLGDALIRFSIDHELSDRGLTPQMKRDGVATVFPGGGSLVPMWDSRRVIERMEPDERGLILPHTLRGMARLLRERPGIQIIARDLQTWQHLKDGGVDAGRLFVADDAAFWLQTWVQSQTWESPERTLIAFRGDIESAGNHAIDQDMNFDVSQTWTSTWSESDETRSAATAFLGFLARFEAIVTDRLHVAIGAALLGRECFLFDNSYGKNRSVHEFSLRGKFDCVTWCDSIDDVPATVLRSAVSRAEARATWSHVVTDIPQPESRPVRFQDRVMARVGMRTVSRIRRELSEIQGLGIRLTPSQASAYVRIRLGRMTQIGPTMSVSPAFEILMPDSSEDLRTVVADWMRRASPGAALGISHYWTDRGVRSLADQIVEAHPYLDVRRIGATLILVAPFEPM